MSIFAIPFFQKLVSLNDHCIQEPLESTYQDDYRNIADTIAKKKLRQQNAINEDKIKQKKCGSTQTCSKRISTYMNDYRNPHHLLSEYNLLTMALKEQHLNQDCNVNEMKSTQPKTENKASNSNTMKCIYSIGRDRVIIPKWKRIGWRDKKNCWRRPLSERKRFKLTNKVYESKCCGRCIGR